jgi:hypothetical protein
MAISFRWKEIMDGTTGQLINVMEPLNATWSRRADQQYKIDETYLLQEVHERSMPSHGHYFLCIEAAFDNLPEEYDNVFKNKEQLRKHALIRSEYHDKTRIKCASHEDAVIMAAFVIGYHKDYCEVDILEEVVNIYVAKSQSMKAMDKKTFEESKSKVLDYLSGLIGVPVESLISNASTT